MQKKMDLMFLAFLFCLSFANGSMDKLSSEKPLVKFGVEENVAYLQSGQLGIIGGRTTNITYHPFQVAIDKNKTFVCSGALLNKVWVVALATCVASSKPSSLSVRSGSNSNLYDGTVMNVTNIIVHEKYNYATSDYDVALMKLETFICYDRDTTKIDIAREQPMYRTEGLISGWGSDRNKPANKLRELNMTVVARDKCVTAYKETNDTITSSMICATAGTDGPCYGDFGDPLVINDTLYGLYSWSRGCGLPSYPSVFTNLAKVRPWIQEVMQDELHYCFCGKV